MRRVALAFAALCALIFLCLAAALVALPSAWPVLAPAAALFLILSLIAMTLWYARLSIDRALRTALGKIDEGRSEYDHRLKGIERRLAVADGQAREKGELLRRELDAEARRLHKSILELSQELSSVIQGLDATRETQKRQQVMLSEVEKKTRTHRHDALTAVEELRAQNYRERELFNKRVEAALGTALQSELERAEASGANSDLRNRLKRIAKDEASHLLDEEFRRLETQFLERGGNEARALENIETTVIELKARLSRLEEAARLQKDLASGEDRE